MEKIKYKNIKSNQPNSKLNINILFNLSISELENYSFRITTNE